MEENLGNILADGGEIILDSLIENDLLKEIPVLGTSINLIRGYRSLRDRAYLKKVQIFVEQLGKMNDKQRKKLIEESKKDENRRAKFGNALFTTIEQSDSLVKVKYLAVAFEAFLNEDLNEADLRLICHTIRIAFTDELIDIIENEEPQSELKYVVPSGLAWATYPELRASTSSTEPKYELSLTAIQLRDAWRMYST